MSRTQHPQPELRSCREAAPSLLAALPCPSGPCPRSAQTSSQLTGVGWRTKLAGVAPCTTQRAAAGCSSDPNSNFCAAGDPPISSILGVQEAVPHTSICTKTAVGEQSLSGEDLCAQEERRALLPQEAGRGVRPHSCPRCPHLCCSSSYMGPTRRTTKVLDGRCALPTGPHSPTQPTPVGFSSKSCGQLQR